MVRSLLPYRNRSHIQGSIRIESPARSDDPPPNPRLSKNAFPNNLMTIFKDLSRVSVIKLSAADKSTRREETHGKAAAMEDLKKLFPAKILAAYFG